MKGENTIVGFSMYSQHNDLGSCVIAIPLVDPCWNGSSQCHMPGKFPLGTLLLSEDTIRLDLFPADQTMQNVDSMTTPLIAGSVK